MGIQLRLRTTHQPVPIGFAYLGDNFDRADGELIGQSLPVGEGAWANSSGSSAPGPVIRGRALHASAAQGDTVNLVKNTYGTVNLDFLFRIVALKNPSADVAFGAMFCVGGSAEYAMIAIAERGGQLVYRGLQISASGNTAVMGNAPKRPEVGDVCRIEVRGPDFRFYVNGTLQGQGTLSNPAGTHVGLRCYPSDTDTAIDDFAVYRR